MIKHDKNTSTHPRRVDNIHKKNYTNVCVKNRDYFVS